MDGYKIMIYVDLVVFYASTHCMEMRRVIIVNNCCKARPVFSDMGSQSQLGMLTS